MKWPRTGAERYFSRRRHEEPAFEEAYQEAMQAMSPHCDPNVLHARGECEFCDEFPARQQQRIESGINFTGHGPDPATAERKLDDIERWPGNVRSFVIASEEDPQ